jgi:hypothetical protein
VTNTSPSTIDTIRIFENTNYDRSKDNLLSAAEYLYTGNSKSYTVMAGLSYFVEVRYNATIFITIKTSVLKKDENAIVSFFY